MMGILRQVNDHALAADARGNAVDQGRKLIIVMNVGVEIALLLHDDFGAARGQANEVESETGIERIAQSLQPLAKQPVDHLASGHRLPGIDHDGANRAIGAEETGFQPPRALALLCHRRTSVPANPDKVAEITASVATGSAKRFSTM